MQFRLPNSSSPVSRGGNLIPELSRSTGHLPPLRQCSIRWGTVLLITVATLWPAEIRLHPPHRLTVQQGQLLVDCRASRNMLDQEIENYLTYGITLTFSYFITLYRRSFPFSQLVASQVIHKRVTWEIWSERYILETIAGGKTVSTTYATVNQFRPELLELRAIPICPITALKPDEHYYFETRTTLKITQLDSLYHVIFNFLSIFKYKTTWRQGKDFKGSEILETSEEHRNRT